MAEKNGDAKAAEKAAEPVLSAAEVARLINVTVRVPKLDKDGNPVMVLDKDRKKTGVYDIVERRATADDIHGFRIVGDTVRATTVDGQKAEARLK